MPHDRHGRLIEVGDYIKTRPYNTHSRTLIVVGRVADIKQEQSCSGKVCYLDFGKVQEDYFGAEESELVLKSDGSEPVLLTPMPEPATAG